MPKQHLNSLGGTKERFSMLQGPILQIKPLNYSEIKTHKQSLKT